MVFEASDHYKNHSWISNLTLETAALDPSSLARSSYDPESGGSDMNHPDPTAFFENMQGDNLHPPQYNSTDQTRQNGGSNTPFLSDCNDGKDDIVFFLNPYELMSINTTVEP